MTINQKILLIFLAAISLLLAFLVFNDIKHNKQANLSPANSLTAAPTANPALQNNIPIENTNAAINTNAAGEIPIVIATQTPASSAATATALLTEPLSSARSRVTKKPFGIKVSPKNSPVSPERFTGYHTGVDFEILPGEENVDVPVAAICSGPLTFSGDGIYGYGGAAAQECKLNKETVMIIYGHLKFDSIKKVGIPIAAGEQIGILGKGYSTETDGERKHLHLGIYKGKEGDLTGYVSTVAALKDWINPLNFLP